MKRLVFLIALVAILFSTSASKADLVLTIGNIADIGNASDDPFGPIQAGDSASIPLLAHVTGLTPPLLTSYSLTIDFGGDGDNIPSFFTAPTFSSGIGGDLTTTSAAGGGAPFDFVLTWNGSFDLSDNPAAPTTLFTIDFGSQPTTPAGIFDINFGTGSTAEALTAFSNAALTEVQFDNGQFEITAVPEPTGFAVVLVGFASACAMRRRRS